VIFHSYVNVYRRVSQGISAATAVGSVDSVDLDRGATGPSLASHWNHRISTWQLRLFRWWLCQKR
jgi:hypothetical protein